jgi:hypothetical protein
LESVGIVFEEMTWIDVESGIEIKKKYRDEQEELLVMKGDKPVKKRTPLQLACALGLFKLVELLLSKGANPNGVDPSTDVLGHTDFYFPPIVLCASRRLRQTLLDELAGISIWQVFDNNYEVSHVQCLEALLRMKADPNLDIAGPAAKPFPIFYCLKQRNFVAKLV